MLRKCRWEGCSATTERWFDDGWSYLSWEPEGPNNELYCPEHAAVFEGSGGEVAVDGRDYDVTFDDDGLVVSINLIARRHRLRGEAGFEDLELEPVWMQGQPFTPLARKVHQAALKLPHPIRLVRRCRKPERPAN